MEATKEDVATALSALGYEISRQWRFRLREERTPSAQINNNGTIHDFGSGWHGDLISLLQEYKGFKTFKEAKQEAERLLGIESELDFVDFEKKSDEKIDSPLPDKFMVPHRIDAKNNRQSYLYELKQLFQGTYQGKDELIAPWSELLKIAKKYDIQYNKKSGRLIMPLRDLDGKIRTFWKYKKRGAAFVNKDGKEIPHRKILYTKNRVRPPFAVMDLLEYSKDKSESILITEGEKDAMAATANGLRAVCIGGAGASKTILPKYLELFKNLDVIIAGDYDKAGSIFNENISEQLKPIVNSIKILDWVKKSKKDGFKLHPKFDLADYFTWKNNFNKEKVRVEQISTVEIEIELNEGQSVDDFPEKLFNNGKLTHVETRVLK